MAEETLGKVAALLEEALAVHESVEHVVLSTKEGVVVAALSRHENADPNLIATVTAALVWGGSTALVQLGQAKPFYLSHVTGTEKIITIVQPNYNLAIVLNRDTSFDLQKYLSEFQSLATRIELIMKSAAIFGEQTILGRIVERVPEITQAMLLTQEGLPLGSVGLDDDIEVAALTSSVFANGLTFSPHTENITVNTPNMALLIARLDESRLIAVICRGQNPDDICVRVKEVIQDYI
ncbi:MAG: hypothetical protein BAJATHORv1_40114 [Candidatus Thorarchaeota archaeon]|nr:MAG: hypothetical protein BAJATHORv1_40114 [Candidatus Thorarchaeota archaeon]